jgi:hypothetical protein
MATPQHTYLTSFTIVDGRIFSTERLLALGRVEQLSQTCSRASRYFCFWPLRVVAKSAAFGPAPDSCRKAARSRMTELTFGQLGIPRCKRWCIIHSLEGRARWASSTARSMPSLPIWTCRSIRSLRSSSSTMTRSSAASVMASRIWKPSGRLRRTLRFTWPRSRSSSPPWQSCCWPRMGD